MREQFLYKCMNCVPIDFDKMGTKDFRKLTDVIFSNEPEHRKKMIATLVFLKWRAYFFKDYQLVEFTNLVDWLFIPGNSTEKTMIPYFWHKGRRIFGPKDQLHHIKWGTWRIVADYFELYEKDQKLTYLTRACALLYPGRNYERQCLMFEKHDVALRLAIYWNWILHINAMAENFPYLFKKSKKAEKSKKVHLWYEFMMEWMDFKVEDFKKKDDLEAMEVLSSLNLQIKKAKEKEKEPKKK